MTDHTPEEDEAFDELSFRLTREQIVHAMARVDHELEVFRNETLEEVAQHLEHKFSAPFGTDTIASFAAYIRGMKT